MSVRKFVSDALDMKTKRAGLKAILRKIARPADRSSLFHWMVEHHDELLSKTNDTRLIWADLCVSFKELGLTNRDGQPATEMIARKTWYRARKPAAEKKARALTRAMTGLSPRSLMPSASRQNRTPIELTRPTSSSASPAGSQPLPSNSAASPPPNEGGPISPEAAKAKIARLRRTLEERSGR